jgi:membrane protease YdiL (CAAX protease family)
MRKLAGREPAGSFLGGPLSDVAWFAVIAIAITVVAGVPVLLSTQATPVAGVIPPPRPIILSQPLAQFLIAVSAAGPALAALIVVAMRSSMRGAGPLLAQLLRWKTNPLWYLLALAGPTAVGLLALVISGLMGRPSAASSLLTPSALSLVLLILQGLGQEIGWRGFAFPRLQLRVGPFYAALLTGTIWFVWREWRLITPGGRFLIQPFGLVLLFLLLLAASVIIGWMYNRSGRCLPVAWAANIGLLLMASIVTVQLFQFALVVGLFLLVAAVILMIDGAETRSG